MDIITAIIIAASIPSAVTGFSFWLLQRKVTKRDKQIEQKQLDQINMQVMMIEGNNASIALGEATAKALRDGRCNGEVTAALEYAAQVKHRQKEFLTAQAAKQLR